MADVCAEKGCLFDSDADPICSKPTKYGFLQLHIKALLYAQVVEDELNLLLPHDEAPDEQILCQIIVLTSC